MSGKEADGDRMVSVPQRKLQPIQAQMCFSAVLTSDGEDAADEWAADNWTPGEKALGQGRSVVLPEGQILEQSTKQLHQPRVDSSKK
jgi:coproporphyrinogen III oxidase